MFDHFFAFFVSKIASVLMWLATMMIGAVESKDDDDCVAPLVLAESDLSSNSEVMVQLPPTEEEKPAGLSEAEKKVMKTITQDFMSQNDEVVYYALTEVKEFIDNSAFADVSTRRLCNKGLLLALTMLMNLHDSDEALTCQIMKIVVTLVGEYHEDLQSLGDVGMLRAILQAMKRFPRSEKIQEDSIFILYFISEPGQTEKEFQELYVMDVMSLLYSVLNAFEGNSTLVEQGVQVVDHLARLSENFRTSLCNAGLLQAVVRIMVRYEGDEGMNEFTKPALINLSNVTNEEFKYSISWRESTE